VRCVDDEGHLTAADAAQDAAGTWLPVVVQRLLGQLAYDSASTPLRRRTAAVPEVATTVKPRSASRLTGKIMCRLSRLATETKTVPLVGNPPPRPLLSAPICALAKAVPKPASMPITSPVERISGPSTVSTVPPSKVRNRLKGITASLTATGAVSGTSPPSPCAGSRPSVRSSATVAPSMTRAAALASAVPVALDTNGTVRDARGLASST
jgi:hypothetical protein